MHRSHCLLVGLFITASFGAQAQINVNSRQIKITIPLHSELTPVQRLNSEGVAAVQKRHYERAEQLFYRAYLFDPADPFTLNNLAYVAQINGQVDRAESFYKLATEIGCYAIIDRSSDKSLTGKPMMDALGSLKNIPMRVNRINVLGMQLMSQGRGFEAQTLFVEALKLKPADPFTLNDLGAAEESIGDADSALTHYDAAAALHSKELILSTYQRSARGKPVSEVAADSAAELRKRIRDKSPAEIKATMLTIRGISETNRNDWASARKDFLEAYSLNPQGAFALNNLGYVTERDGDLETARSYYARALRAETASDRVGMTTNPLSQGERLSSVAEESRSKVDVEMMDEADKRRTNKGAVTLIPRAGQTLPASPVPAHPTQQLPQQ